MVAPRCRSVLVFALAAFGALLSAPGHAAVDLRGSCSYAVGGGFLDPHAPSPNGSCDVFRGPSPLSDIAGGLTTAASAVARYEAIAREGEMSFAIEARVALAAARIRRPSPPRAAERTCALTTPSP